MEENQEQMMQLQMLGQEAQELEKQLQLIEQHISDLNKLREGLEEIEKSEEKNIYANIGKGIFIPAEIKNKKLIVEVGNKNLVNKSIPETQEIISKEKEKLNNVKIEIMDRVEILQKEMQEIFGQGKDCKCEDENCNCINKDECK